MKTYMILNAVGKDRPGIVEEVSTFLFERGANIEDSRMAAMGGCFSIMMLFSCDAEQRAGIEGDLQRLSEAGLQAGLHAAEDPGAASGPPALPLEISIRAMDHRGIVRQVVRILHRHGVNIQSMDTHVTRAPLSGADLFDLTIEAAVPFESPIVTIKEELTELAADMNMDLSF